MAIQAPRRNTVASDAHSAYIERNKKLSAQYDSAREDMNGAPSPSDHSMEGDILREADESLDEAAFRAVADERGVHSFRSRMRRETRDIHPHING